MIDRLIEKHLAVGNDFHSWKIPSWQRVILGTMEGKSCHSLTTIVPTCQQRLIITHQDPSMDLPEALLSKFGEPGGRVMVNLKVLAPIWGSKLQGKHSCKELYERWGVHEPWMAVKSHIIEKRYAEFSFTSKLFPITGGVRWLSERFPELCFKLTYAAQYCARSGELVFEKGDLRSGVEDDYVSLDRWIASGGKREFHIDETSDPWGHFALAKPGPAAMLWLKDNGLEYDEDEVLSAIRKPFIRFVLRKGIDDRLGGTSGLDELTAMALGIRIDMADGVGLKDMKVKGVEYCRQIEHRGQFGCHELEPRNPVSWAESYKIMMHAVNYIRHNETNYDHVRQSFGEINNTELLFILKLKACYVITERLPKTAVVNNGVMRGERLHYL